MPNFTCDEFIEMVNDNLLDDVIDNVFEEARSAIIQEAKSCYQDLKDCSNDFFNYVDKDATSAIEKLKKAGNNTKIKLSSGIKTAMKTIDKQVPDMLTNMNKYTKGTVYGKLTLVGSEIAGWTIPPLIPIPGASEMLFTAAEVLNYLLEFKRKWSGSNRSAINDFIIRCDKATQDIDMSMMGAEKTCNSAMKLFRYMKTTISKIVQGVLITLQGNTIKQYKKVYAGTEKIAEKIEDKTSGTKAKPVQATNKFANKLKNVSNELSHDADKAIDAYNKYKATKKQLKDNKKKKEFTPKA